MKKPRAPKSIGRKRRAAGWTLLALGVIVAGVWVASGWWSIGVARWGIANGGLHWTPYAVASRVQRYGSGDWSWWLGWNPAGKVYSGNQARSFGLFACQAGDIGTMMGPSPIASLLLWPMPLLLWTPAALLLRSGILARRRAVTNACTKCGYSLAGIAKDAPCPECGKRIS